MTRDELDRLLGFLDGCQTAISQGELDIPYSIGEIEKMRGNLWQLYHAAPEAESPCACGDRKPLKRFKAILRRYPSGAMELHFKTLRAGDVPVEVLYLPISEPQEDAP